MKNWSQLSYKQQVRQETIIDIYREFFAHSIPIAKQYWSLSGDCTNEGERTETGELGHLVACGLIKETQFHGVERDVEVYERNLKAYPKAHWYNNDIYSEMCKAKHFNPAIVNFDTVSAPNLALPELEDILHLVPSNTMVVCNMVLSCRGSTFELDTIDKVTGVDYYPHLMQYMKPGTNTVMGTIICLKR